VAVFDETHPGDIRGAFGTVTQRDAGGRRSWGSRLLTLLAIMGPGMIVMVGDNDAGGVATYALAGQNYGYSLLWVMVILVPVLAVSQEMVLRLGAVTGVGLTRLLRERFGRFWGGFSVASLIFLNVLTIATEFIGISLSLGYFGVSRFVSDPIAALLLIVMTATGSFRRWERFMFVFIFANLLLVPLVLLSHPSTGHFFHGLLVPGVRGGFNSTATFMVISLIGTTIAPWQLFFQQSNVIDKGISPRWINYERADTFIGSVVTQMGSCALIAICAGAFSNTPLFGHFTDAGGVARGLEHYVGYSAGALFSIILLNASLIGAATVTLSGSYAFGDAFGLRHSLDQGWREAKGFYGLFVGAVAVSAGIVMVPGAPLGLITTGVQALAGILLPSTMVFLLVLCNDREVLGPWVNQPWLNAVATLIVSILFSLALILMVTTLFPRLDATLVLACVGGLLVAVLAVLAVASVVSRWRREAVAPVPAERRMNWRMPPATLLQRPPETRTRKTVLWAMWAYLMVTVVMLGVKVVQLGLHG
jgi:Mn2+/Fe2+ NRAMP family transporter